MYDFIGDVHGRSEKLRTLLDKLGYVCINGVYSHTDRKAFFLGDIVDRGNDVKGCVEIIRPMVESGSAKMIMGNHEYNLICYFTLIDGSKKQFVRSHDENHDKQCKTSLAYFNTSQGRDSLEWLKTLPLWYEENDFRAVHACWHQMSIKKLEFLLDGPYINDSFLQESRKVNNEELYDAIEIVLKGPEVELPKGITPKEDDYGEMRDEIRIAWWDEKKVVCSKQEIPELDVSKIENSHEYYPKNEKNVFFGHYGINEDPYLTSINAQCLDFDVKENKKLVAYSFNDEEILTLGNLVYV